MKSKKYILFLILFFNIITYSQVVPKKGGICFRTDDDQPISNYQEYAEIFNQYGKNFTCAINYGKDQITPEYVDMLEQLQLSGHEVMAHTPWHSTVWFSTKLGTEYYINHPGVQRINGNNIELKHEEANISFSKRNGWVNINGNIVTSDAGIFASFSKSDCYIYFPSLDKLVFTISNNGWIDDYNVEVSDFWGKSIDLGTHTNIQFYNFDFNNIHLTLDAIRALAEESIRIAESYNLIRPYSWIQPGGYHPHVHRNELKQALFDNLGFNTGGIFPDPSLKVFNEFNPDNDKQFGMNFGDFRDDIWTLEDCKEFIADKIAKHRVVIGHSHFNWGELLGGWNGFLDRTEELIQWCIENDIPIRTYSEWADILYYQTPNPYENIFPTLDRDLDENGVPDGYETLAGLWKSDDGVDSSNNYCYSIDSEGTLFRVDNLGGLEKGDNSFEVWTKGEIGDEIEVNFEVGTEEYKYVFPAESSEWTLYNLSQSTNGNYNVNIPENLSMVNISIRCSNYSSGEVKVSGMSLKKKGIQLSLKVFLEGSYNQNGEMHTYINSTLPNMQPFASAPWNYYGDEAIAGTLNPDVVDWVLVSIKSDANSSSFVTRRAALLKKDGNIVDLNGIDPIELKVFPGQYYVQVDHRNHLNIMSANLVSID